MADSSTLHRVPPPLPGKGEPWVLKVASKLTLNDRVMVVHNALKDHDKLSKKYIALLNAVYDEQAVEGSLSADNTLAAQMIRNYAEEKDANDPLIEEKLATISKALAVVLRRYGFSRKDRRDMLGGEVVPNNTSE